MLPPELGRLYLRMAPVDRRHGLDVYRRLLAAGQDDRLLLQTALLHDVGKAGTSITVWHRTARVLLASRAGRLWRWLAGRPSGWRRPFWDLAHHPQAGSDLVRAHGACPEMADLIRHHEAEAPEEWRGTEQGRRHAALAAVDAVC